MIFQLVVSSADDPEISVDSGAPDADTSLLTSPDINEDDTPVGSPVRSRTTSSSGSSTIIGPPVGSRTTSSSGSSTIVGNREADSTIVGNQDDATNAVLSDQSSDSSVEILNPHGQFLIGESGDTGLRLEVSY